MRFVKVAVPTAMLKSEADEAAFDKLARTLRGPVPKVEPYRFDCYNQDGKVIRTFTSREDARQYAAQDSQVSLIVGEYSHKEMQSALDDC